MSEHQRAAVVVHAVEVGTGRPREYDVVDRERVVGLDGIHLPELEVCTTERSPGRVNRRLGHVSQRRAGEPKSQQLDHKRLIVAQLARLLRGRDEHPCVRVSGMSLCAERNRTAIDDRLQFGETLVRRKPDAFVTGQLRDGFPEAWIGHRKWQRHVAPLECLVVVQRHTVLLFAAEDQGMLLLRGDVVFLRDILGRLCHGVATQRVAGHVLHDEVFGLTGAARCGRIRVIDVWSVGGTIAGYGQSAVRHPGPNFLGGREHDSNAGGAGLRNRRAAEAIEAREARQPRQTIERALLGARHAQHAIVDRGGVNVPAGKFLSGHVGRKAQAMQIGQATLPPRKRRRPVTTVWNFDGIGHRFSCDCFIL